MKSIKIILGLVMFTNFLLNGQTADTTKKENGLVWHTDVLKANDISQASHKPLFAFFTGSDWCFWCKKLQAEVFSKPEFIQWAKKNVVLVELDFPRGKTLSPELTQQNNSLQQTFGVQGYPTIWMFFLNKSADGSKYDIQTLGSLGYPPGAEKGREQLKFISDANALLAKGNKK